MGTYGYRADGDSVAEDYVIEIISGDDIVRGIMQSECPIPRNTNRWGKAIEAGGELVTQLTKKLPGANGVGEIVTKFMSSPLGNAMGNLGGTSTQAAWFTRRVWCGAEQSAMSVTMKFEASTDAHNEVWAALFALSKMALPTDYHGILIPPGPFPTPSLKIGGGGKKISIQIGSSIYIDNVVIDDVAPKFSDKMTSSGYPIEGVAVVTFFPFQTVTTQALEKWMKGNG